MDSVNTNLSKICNISLGEGTGKRAKILPAKIANRYILSTINEYQKKTLKELKMVTSEHQAAEFLKILIIHLILTFDF